MVESVVPFAILARGASRNRPLICQHRAAGEATVLYDAYETIGDPGSVSARTLTGRRASSHHITLSVNTSSRAKPRKLFSSISLTLS